MRSVSFMTFGLVFLLAGCGSDSDDGSQGATGSGDVSLTSWGEEYIEVGIPAGEFADGWSMKYDRFLINLGNVRIADGSGTVAGSIAGHQVLDMVKPGPHDIGTLSDLPAKGWERFSYDIVKPDANAALHASATEADKTLLTDNGWAVYVAGSATKGAVTKTFAWGFSEGTSYSECVADIDGKETPGVLVTNGGKTVVQMTIHGDHFFYDDLAAETAVLRFDAIANADSDGNDEVTRAELDAVKLADIPEGTYGTGAANIDDLGPFVTKLVSTLGHYQGEGHCVETHL